MSYEQMRDQMREIERRYRSFLRGGAADGLTKDEAIEAYTKLGYSEGQARRYIEAIREGKP